MTAFVTFAAFWSFGYTVADIVIRLYENHKVSKYDEELQKILDSACTRPTIAPDR